MTTPEDEGLSGPEDDGLAGRLTSSSYRHAYLLASLVLILVVRPFLGDGRLSPWILDGFLYVTMLAGAFAATSSRVQGIVTAVLALIAIPAQLYWRTQQQEEVDATLIVFLLATLLLLANVALLFLRNLFRESDRVTADTIYSAVSVYLLMGMAWTLAFLLLEIATPGSFSFPEPLTDYDNSFDRLLGFSFTTLTTLGYGNIAPATSQADALANAEAVSGTLYLTVVIARLVGIQISQTTAGSAR